MTLTVKSSQNSTDLFLHENTHPKPMRLTEENKEDFKQAILCYISENPFRENEKRWKTIVISQENIEEQHTTNVIFSVEDIIWPFLIYQVGLNVVFDISVLRLIAC